jgi:hypothetical protein
LGCNRRELIGDNQNSRPEKMVDAGQPCEFDTRGPLQRAHIIANWPPIYIGKESDRHSEEGEDFPLPVTSIWFSCNSLSASAEARRALHVWLVQDTYTESANVFADNSV